MGKAVRVGSKVKHISLGDRVGVGAQARSCLRPECPDCSVGLENYCKLAKVDTYNSAYPDGGGQSYGGYADYNRTHSRFVFRIPDGLSSALAAPMLCGGVTMYAPLRDNGCGPGKRVGIVGVGGLGHFGILFAKALGADRVVGISRKEDKRTEVLKLGADEYIATDEEQGWEAKHAPSLDLIIGTVSSVKMPLSGYLKLLDTNGTFIQVGYVTPFPLAQFLCSFWGPSIDTLFFHSAPDGGRMPEINAFTLIGAGIKVGGSGIGSPGQIQEMLQFAADKGIKPWVEERPMQKANETVVDLEAGKARYRYVLVNEKHAS